MNPAEPPRRWFGLTASIAVLLGVAVLMRASQNMAQTTFPLVGGDLLHMSTTGVGILAAGSAAVAVVSMVMFASQLQRRQLLGALLVALLLMGISLLLIGASHSVLVLAVAVLLLGLASGIVGPTLLTTVGSLKDQDPVKDVRDQPIALLSVALSTGLAIGPFAEMSLLVGTGGSIRYVFSWFALGPLVAALLVAVVMARRSTWYRIRRGASLAGHISEALPLTPDGIATGVLGPIQEDGAGERKPEGRHDSRVSFASALHDRGFQLALLGQLIYAAPFSAVIVFGALFERHGYGMTVAQVQVAFGLFFVASFAVRLALASRSQIRHKVGWLKVAALTTIAGLVLLASGHSGVQLMVAMAVLGIPHGLTFPLAMALVAERRGHRELASLNAHIYAVLQVVSMALPPLLGATIAAAGFRVAFLLLILPVVVCGGMLQWRAGPRGSAPLPPLVNC